MLQLLHMFDKWTEYLEGGGQIDTVYSDFEKAFDKVPHKRPISKLYSYGLHDSIINWIFTAQRYASAVLAVIMCLCLSVCLSQVRVVQRWLNLGSD